MSFYGLLNKRCSYRRRQNTGTNVYGEIQFTEMLIASDRPCSRQPGFGQNMQKLVEVGKEGTTNVKLVTYFFGYSDDLREGDLITMSDIDQGVVRNVMDAAGRSHHKEVTVEEVQSVGEKDKVNG